MQEPRTNQVGSCIVLGGPVRVFRHALLQSEKSSIGAYFGPRIFGVTPFESAPVFQAIIDVTTGDGSGATQIKMGEVVIETLLSDVSALHLVEHSVGALPFVQQGGERSAGLVSLKINGREVPLSVPPVGIRGGPAAVLAPCGLYARP